MFTVTLLFQNITLSFEISGKNIWAPQIFKKGSKVEKSLKEKTFWQVSFSWGRDFRWKQQKAKNRKVEKSLTGIWVFGLEGFFFLTASSKQKCFGKSEPDFFPSQKNFRLFLLKQNIFFSSHFSGLQYFQFSRHFSDFYWDPTFKVSAEQRKG